MDSYEVISTEFEEAQMDKILEYISIDLWNPDAAKRVYQDAIETARQLSWIAESNRYCEDEDLKKMKYRKINFIKHKYVYIYRVIDEIAIVEAVYHQSQDYENIFANDIGIKKI